MNGIMGGGPMIKGNFTNKNTGETIFVKDCIDTGDGMILTTSIGQIPMKEFMNVYVQMSDEVYDEKGNVIGNANDAPAPKAQPKEKGITAESLDIDFVDFSKFAPEEPASNQMQVPAAPKSKKSTSYDMVDKLFKKIKPDLNLKVTFDLDKFPQKEVVTLVKYLDVQPEEVANYLYDNYVKDEIIDILKDNIDSMVDLSE